MLAGIGLRGWRPASERASARLRFKACLVIHGLFTQDAFSNLISNAIKYSPSGSPIDVVARQEPGRMVVQVRDHGIGIPARDRSRLFERYFRGSNATAVA